MSLVCLRNYQMREVLKKDEKQMQLYWIAWIPWSFDVWNIGQDLFGESKVLSEGKFINALSVTLLWWTSGCFWTHRLWKSPQKPPSAPPHTHFCGVAFKSDGQAGIRSRNLPVKGKAKWINSSFLIGFQRHLSMREWDVWYSGWVSSWFQVINYDNRTNQKVSSK